MLTVMVAVIISVLFIRGVSEAGTLEEIRRVIQEKGADWVAGETSMSKLPKDELKALFSSAPEKAPENVKVLSLETPVGGLPPRLDWRDNGGNFVTPVKSQIFWGPSGAFAATAALESYTLIQNNTPNVNLDLSEQVLISCGGFPYSRDSVFSDYLQATEFIQKTGLPLETCYPYAAHDYRCDAACPNWKATTYKIPRYEYINRGYASVDGLKKALFKYGPLPVFMRAFEDFLYYRGGVYGITSNECLGFHHVLLIGYDDAGKYFIAKNSWGTGWGEEGFFRISYYDVGSDAVRLGWFAIAYVGGRAERVDTLFGSSGGKGILKVTAASEDRWQASTFPESWITITSNDWGFGEGNVTYSVAPNPDVGPRTEGIIVNNECHMITQEGKGKCTYTLSRNTQAFGTAGGTGSVGVVAGTGCYWAAEADEQWITVTSGDWGFGNGTVAYSVAPNPLPSSRTGRVTIGEAVLTITQDRAPGEPKISVKGSFSSSVPVNFGSVPVNTYRSYYLEVGNSGTGPLVTVINVWFSPDTSHEFSYDVGSRWFKHVAPGRTETLCVGFKPSATGTRKGTLKIYSNDPTNPVVTVPLTGIGQ